MSLPLSRDFNAVDTGPLPHTTINNLQDAVVERHHGSVKVHVGPNSFHPVSQWVQSTISWTHSTVTGANLLAPMNYMPEGSILTEAALYTENSGSGKSIGWLIAHYDEVGGDLVSLSTVNTTAGGKNTLLALDMPHTILPGRLYYMWAFAGAGSTDTITVWGASLTFHKL